jgi:hypothetical protein
MSAFPPIADKLSSRSGIFHGVSTQLLVSPSDAFENQPPLSDGNVANPANFRRFCDTGS